MPGIRFYFDEDSSDRAVVDSLRAQGIEVLTALEAGMVERSDEEQFAFAMRQGLVLYTANVGDFARLHAQHVRKGGAHPGIVVRTWQRTPISIQIRGLAALNARHSPGDLRDRLLYLSEFID